MMPLNIKTHYKGSVCRHFEERYIHLNAAMLRCCESMRMKDQNKEVF